MRLVILTICLAGFTAVLAQDIPQSEVPSLVVNAFQSKFPNAKDVEWETKGELYKAEFEIGKRDHELWIDKSGNITKHKEDFPKSQLPAAIAQKIKSDFSTYTIDDVDKIEEAGKVFYKVDLESSAGDKKVLFGADGTIQPEKK